jgi:FKBP-type peptidyl-prolyl cis-trans isomerase
MKNFGPHRTVLCAFLTALYATSCTKCNSQGDQAAVKDASSSTTTTDASAAASASELQIVDVVVGTGAEAVSGKKVTVHYTGTLPDGKKFDSSLDRNAPFTFNLGQGQVIQGWEKGFSGMKIGGKRKLTIPASMGYGEAGVPGVIPPNSTLLFDVELLKVE